MKTIFAYCCIAVTTVALLGCGGGGSSEPEPQPPTPPVNQAPTVAAESIAVAEKEVAVVSATASDDGSIASYLWEVTNGQAVTITNSDSDTVSFTAPSVTQDEEISLRVTVTDNLGLTASAEVAVTVEQSTIPLTLAGKATDSPLAHANISVILSGQDEPITATADADGNYSVDLLLDDDQINDFITIIAKGVGQQEVAGLISLVGTVAKLKAQAGEDNILTADENFSVQVTNITTAQYALIKQAIGDEEITTDEQLQDRLAELSARRVLQISTALKVAIDKSNDDASLVISESDTLELVNQPGKLIEYIAKVSTTQSYEDAGYEISNDRNLFISSDVRVPENYLLAPTCPTCNSIGTASFNDNLTGRWYTTDKDFNKTFTDFTWSQTRGELQLDFNEPLIKTVNLLDPEARRIIESVRHLVSIKLKAIQTLDEYDVLHITLTYITTNENGSVEEDFSGFIHGYKNLTKINPTISDNIFIPIYVDTYITQLDSIRLNKDGTGTSDREKLSIEWRIIGERIVILGYQGSDLIINKVDKNLMLVQFANNLRITEGSVTADIYSQVFGFGTIQSPVIPWTNESVPGVYVHPTQDLEKPYRKAWVEFKSDGTLTTIDTYDFDLDGVISGAEQERIEPRILYGYWRVTDKGKLLFTRYKYPDQENYEASGCNPELENCIIFNEIEWTLYSLESKRHEYVQYSRQVDEQNSSNSESEGWSYKYVNKADELPVRLELLD